MSGTPISHCPLSVPFHLFKICHFVFLPSYLGLNSDPSELPKSIPHSTSQSGDRNSNICIAIYSENLPYQVEVHFYWTWSSQPHPKPALCGRARVSLTLPCTVWLWRRPWEEEWKHKLWKANPFPLPLLISRAAFASEIDHCRQIMANAYIVLKRYSWHCFTSHLLSHFTTLWVRFTITPILQVRKLRPRDSK